ncbi:MAG: hypothetical protein HWQ44_14470 [Nostoc sp. JL34]|uniref:hypothetical protein n=1 Tax=Nostoc sp. JL34 TaxID=2815397 RepID=UPI001D1D455C|nr:hypothetical protein [Nostoc sp. JL34]MBN3884136.1 hypothetical protein [Nostoc sp. JL34]
MSISNDQLEIERQNAVRENFAKSLGLRLNDSEVAILLKGEVLSLQDLLRDHSLTDIGNLLIRLDTILQMNANQQNISSLSMSTLHTKDVTDAGNDTGDLTLDARLEGISKGKCKCPSGCICVLILGLCIKNCNFSPLSFYLPSN